MKKALIIGGAGFIGAHLALALAEAGERVDILDNFSRGVRDPFLQKLATMSSVRVIDADMLTPEGPARLGDDYGVIYQFAAIIGVRHVLERPYEVLRDNVAIHDAAIRLARRQRALDRFVFASTSEVYAGALLHMDMPIPTPEHVPLALTDLANARTSYMLSKIYGEAMCHHSGLPFTVVRPHNVYGPRMGLVHVLPELMLKVRTLPPGGQLPVASMAHRRAFCFIDDAVEMLRRLTAAQVGVRRVFNIGNQAEEIAIADVARTVARTAGRDDVEIVALPETPGSPARRCPDMSETLAAINFNPRINFGEGVARTYKWYVDSVFSSDGVSAT